MSAPVVTADDIAAIRAEEGGIANFIAMLANRPAAAESTPPVIGSAHGPAHRPGAWPAGTRTDRPTCDADCDCAINHPPALPAA